MDLVTLAYRFRAAPLEEKDAAAARLFEQIEAQQTNITDALKIAREGAVLATKELQSQGIDVRSVLKDLAELEKVDEEIEDDR